MLILVGLGNPEKRFENTYHNAGFLVVDGIARAFGEKFSKKMFDSEICTFKVNGEKIVLAKPLTYMNNSGIAVSQIIRKFKCDPAKDLLIISDDIDIEPQTIRIRRQSNNSTHNGVKSIAAHLGTNEFLRLKISIGPKHERKDLADHVLSKIGNAETKVAIERATEAGIEFVKTHDIDAVMRKYSS